MNSNATCNFTDPVPLSVKFISFAAHSKFEFNCDYGVFRECFVVKSVELIVLIFMAMTNMLQMM